MSKPVSLFDYEEEQSENTMVLINRYPIIKTVCETFDAKIIQSHVAKLVDDIKKTDIAYRFPEGTTVHIPIDRGLLEVVFDYRGTIIEVNKKQIPYAEYLKTDHWQERRKEALDYYGDCCVLCSNTERLNVHHRHYNTLGNENVKTDLIVLCQKCHERHHNLFQ